MITVRKLIDELGLKLVAGSDGVNAEVSNAYIGDLLSWVIANAKAGSVWITIQGHINVIAVASLTCVSCVILAESSKPEPDAQAKADDEGIPILLSDLTAYQLAKKLAELGV